MQLPSNGHNLPTCPERCYTRCLGFCPVYCCPRIHSMIVNHRQQKFIQQLLQMKHLQMRNHLLEQHQKEYDQKHHLDEGTHLIGNHKVLGQPSKQGMQGHQLHHEHNQPLVEGVNPFVIHQSLRPDIKSKQKNQQIHSETHHHYHGEEPAHNEHGIHEQADFQTHIHRQYHGAKDQVESQAHAPYQQQSTHPPFIDTVIHQVYQQVTQEQPESVIKTNNYFIQDRITLAPTHQINTHPLFVSKGDRDPFEKPQHHHPKEPTIPTVPQIQKLHNQQEEEIHKLSSHQPLIKKSQKEAFSKLAMQLPGFFKRIVPFTNVPKKQVLKILRQNITATNDETYLPAGKSAKRKVINDGQHLIPRSKTTDKNSNFLNVLFSKSADSQNNQHGSSQMIRTNSPDLDVIKLMSPLSFNRDSSLSNSSPVNSSSNQFTFSDIFFAKPRQQITYNNISINTGHTTQNKTSMIISNEILSMGNLTETQRFYSLINFTLSHADNSSLLALLQPPVVITPKMNVSSRKSIQDFANAIREHPQFKKQNESNGKSSSDSTKVYSGNLLGQDSYNQFRTEPEVITSQDSDSIFGDSFSINLEPTRKHGKHRHKDTTTTETPTGQNLEHLSVFATFVPELSSSKPPICTTLAPKRLCQTHFVSLCESIYEDVCDSRTTPTKVQLSPSTSAPYDIYYYPDNDFSIPTRRHTPTPDEDSDDGFYSLKVVKKRKKSMMPRVG